MLPNMLLSHLLIRVLKIKIAFQTFLPFFSAYRENYSAQHVLITLVEECKKHLDNNEIVGGILIDLSKTI